VYRLMHTGSLPHYRVGGSYRVERADFERWRDTIKAGGIE
jgi:excisionase family DNA binding protein